MKSEDKKIHEIAIVLKRFYKNSDIKIKTKNPFKILIRTIISQRTKEETTDKTSKRLFKIASTPKQVLKLTTKQIENLIKPCGFYRQKAKRIKKICKILVEKYNSKVPNNREELMKLPGVGRKTADVVLCDSFNKPMIAVDVHVDIISKRLGLVNKRDDYETIRKKLENIFPLRYRKYINLGFVNFGRQICKTRNPRCGICPLKDVCNYYNKKKN